MHMNRRGMGTILFDQSIPGGTNNLILEMPVHRPGTITKMTIRFYPGQQKTLQVRPFVQRPPDGVEELAQYTGTRKYFSGDNDIFEIKMDFPIDAEYKISLDISNVSSPAQTYDVYVIFEIDYYDGKGRS